MKTYTVLLHPRQGRPGKPWTFKVQAKNSKDALIAVDKVHGKDWYVEIVKPSSAESIPDKFATAGIDINT